MPLSKETTDQIRKEAMDTYPKYEYELNAYINGAEAYAEKGEIFQGILKDFVSIARTRWRRLPSDSFEKKTLNAATKALEQFK